jgi:hypothetical protein
MFGKYIFIIYIRFFSDTVGNRLLKTTHLCIYYCLSFYQSSYLDLTLLALDEFTHSSVVSWQISWGNGWLMVG